MVDSRRVENLLGVPLGAGYDDTSVYDGTGTRPTVALQARAAPPQNECFARTQRARLQEIPFRVRKSGRNLTAACGVSGHGVPWRPQTLLCG